LHHSGFFPHHALFFMLFFITTAGVYMLTPRFDHLPLLHADMDFPHSAMSPPYYKIAWSTVLIWTWSVREFAKPEVGIFRASAESSSRSPA
jgi:hypothetical protein